MPQLRAPSWLHLPSIDPTSDTLRAWAAILALLVWVRIAPASSLAMSLRLVWLAVAGLAILGLTIGAHTGRYRSVLVFGIAALTLALGAALAYLLVPHLAGSYLRLTAGRGDQRITALVGLTVMASLAIGRRRGRDLRPADLLVAGVVALFLVEDLDILNGRLMRDFQIYLTAGDQFFHGSQPYLTTVIANQSDALRLGLPFLYPPFALPIFGILAQLPLGLVIVGWLAMSLATAVSALRWLGVGRWWIPILLLWPPLLQGLAVGNVAVLTFGLFVAAPRAPWTLPLMTMFKLQSAVPSIWLIRERRWRSLAIGLGILALVALLTLPIVGLSSWGDWFRGLQLFQESQGRYKALFGIAVPHYVPYAAFLLIAVGAVVAATILGKGRAGLARLGIASVVASPSLYRHGFLVLLPALLGNGELLFWLSMGLGGGVVGLGLTTAIAVIGTFRFASTSVRSAATVHPLGPRGAPWSTLPGSLDRG